MNLFSGFGGGNSCLWILILLLIASAQSDNGLQDVLEGGCTPILMAILYTMWKNGTLCNILGGGNNGGCGCGCNN